MDVVLTKEQRFPRRTESQATGEVGVAIVAKIVRKDLGWVFRRTPQEADFGIDGYIDIVTDLGYVTGRSIAVQVKTGTSYLGSQSTNCHVYRGETRHINYYLNLSQPVVLLIVDPESERAWWEVFDPYETDRVGDYWTLPIKKERRLSPTARMALEAVAGPTTDYIPHLEEFWLIGERIKDASLLCIQVSKIEIANCYVRPFQRVFERLSESREIALSAMNKVDFFIDGYNNDPRELWEIPEVVRWLDAAEKAVRHLVFFLDLDEHAQGVRLLCMCHGGAEKAGTGLVRLNNAHGVGKFMEQQFEWLNDFTVARGVDEVNQPVSEKLTTFVQSLLAGDGG